MFACVTNLLVNICLVTNGYLWLLLVTLHKINALYVIPDYIDLIQITLFYLFQDLHFHAYITWFV